MIVSPCLHEWHKNHLPPNDHETPLPLLRFDHLAHRLHRTGGHDDRHVVVLGLEVTLEVAQVLGQVEAELGSLQDDAGHVCEGQWAVGSGMY